MAAEKSKNIAGPEAEDLFTIDDCWNRIGIWSRAEKRCPELQRYVHCRNCAKYSAAGRHLLSRMSTQEYLDEWTEVLAKEKPKKFTDTKSAFVFRAGGEWLALNASIIGEIKEMGAIHSIPHLRSPIVRGLVNVRGKLEICVSIGAVLGIERLEDIDSNEKYIAPERLVVAAMEGETICFPVSEVMGVVRYHTDLLRDLPVTVSGSKAVYTKGILCINDLEIGFLRDNLLFRTLTKDLA